MTFSSSNYSGLLAQMANEIKQLRLSLPSRFKGLTGIGFTLENDVGFAFNSVFLPHWVFTTSGSVVGISIDSSPDINPNNRVFGSRLEAPEGNVSASVTLPLTGMFLYRQFIVLDSIKEFRQDYYVNGELVIPSQDWLLKYPSKFYFFVDTLIDTKESTQLKIETKTKNDFWALLDPFMLFPVMGL